MPGILKHTKLLAFTCLLFAVETILLEFFHSLSLLLFIAVINLMVIAGYVIGKLTIYAIAEQMKVFNPRSLTRNVDYLFIGDAVSDDFISLQESESIVSLNIPDISLNAAFQILRRTHSILKENGSVIIAVKQKIPKNRIRMIDLFYLHDITIRELKLENLSKIKRLVFFFNPLSCINLIRGRKESGYHEKTWGGGGVLL